MHHLETVEALNYGIIITTEERRHKQTKY